MAEPLKNIYNDVFFIEFTTAIKKVTPQFDAGSFLKNIKNQSWKELELKGRMRHIASLFYAELKGNYRQKVQQLLKITKALPAERSSQYGSLAYMLLPDVIEQYGLDLPEVSLKAMEEVTKLTSCEFAIRPFLLQYPDLVMAQMLKWSTHEDYKLRRFASEGCRPRLPWAMGIPVLKKDPSPILPILENLRNDPSEFVRRSVANNLNDISKDHPELVLQIAQSWYGQTRNTDAIVKHGCRGLLKKGNPGALDLFGTSSVVSCKIWDLAIHPAKLYIGKKLSFSVKITLEEKAPRKLRLEYAVYYLKANGSSSRKIFKISEKSYEPGNIIPVLRQHSFKDLTTRKHFAGYHKLSIIVNGNEIISKDFLLS